MDKSDRRKIGMRLRVARMAAEKTQVEAADFLGVPRTSIVKIESGIQSLKAEHLAKLAGFYNRRAADFFEESFLVSF